MTTYYKDLNPEGLRSKTLTPKLPFWGSAGYTDVYDTSETVASQLV